MESVSMTRHQSQQWRAINIVGHRDNVSVTYGSKNKSESENHKIEKQEIHNAKEKIAQTKACVAMMRCIDFIELFGRLLGWKLSYGWKVNSRHWATIGFTVFALSQCVYTQFKHFMNGQYRSVLTVFAVLGVVLSRLLEIKCFVSYQKELTALHCFIFKLCRQHSDRIADTFEDRQRQNLKLYKLILLMAFGAASTYMFHPIQTFFYNNELESLLPIEIVYIDQAQLSGFLVANAIMVVLSMYSVSVALYLGLHFITTVLNYSMLIDLIEVDIKKLDDFWRDATTTTVAYRRSFLRNICQMCQDKDNYIETVNKIFGEMVTLFICIAYISIIICLYMCKAANWIPGYGVVFGLSIEMLFYCIIGTRVSVLNERLCYILTQCNWYTYDLYSQKIFLNLPNLCMNSKELWIGPFAPLSVFTATEIIKSIYSYYTILVEVL